jgi:hypothetical protein
LGLEPGDIDESMPGVPDDSEIPNMEDDIPVALEPELEVGVADNIISQNGARISIDQKYVRTMTPAPLQVSAKEDNAAFISLLEHEVCIVDWTALALFLQMLLRSAGLG